MVKASFCLNSQIRGHRVQGRGPSSHEHKLSASTGILHAIGPIGSVGDLVSTLTHLAPTVCAFDPAF